MKKKIRKIWYKKKGCKNCAVYFYPHYDEEGVWYERVIGPYHEGKEFSYLSAPHPITHEMMEWKNIYMTSDGTLRIIRKNRL